MHGLCVFLLQGFHFGGERIQPFDADVATSLQLSFPGVSRGQSKFAAAEKTPDLIGFPQNCRPSTTRGIHPG